MFSDIFYGFRTERPLLFKPDLLCRLIEPALSYLSKIRAVILVEVLGAVGVNRKTQHADSVYVLLIGSIVVFPRCIVYCLCGYYVHLIVICETLGNKACIVL